MFEVAELGLAPPRNPGASGAQSPEVQILRCRVILSGQTTGARLLTHGYETARCANEIQKRGYCHVRIADKNGVDPENNKLGDNAI